MGMHLETDDGKEKKQRFYAGNMKKCVGEIIQSRERQIGGRCF